MVLEWDIAVAEAGPVNETHLKQLLPIAEVRRAGSSVGHDPAEPLAVTGQDSVAVETAALGWVCREFS